MTRKDYIKLSIGLSHAREFAERHVATGSDRVALKMIRAAAEEIATAIRQDNPKFNYTRFMRDCGVAELDY